MTELNNIPFFPTNLGGMRIKWVDSNFNGDINKDLTLFNCIGTMYNKNGEVTMETYDPESIRNFTEDNGTKLKVTDRFLLNSMINKDLEFINMQNAWVCDVNDSHFVNINTLAIQYIEISVKDVDIDGTLTHEMCGIRIHYNFCQNVFAASDCRRMMAGNTYALYNKQELDTDGTTVMLHIINKSLGAEIYW